MPETGDARLAYSRDKALKRISEGTLIKTSRHNSGISRRDAIIGGAAFSAAVGVPEIARAAGPQGQLSWGIHVSLAPTWFDPAETPGLITPYMMLYALQDALVKPMPGKGLAPCLAESWSASADGL